MRRPWSMKTPKTRRLFYCLWLGGAIVAMLSCGEPAPLGPARYDLGVPPVDSLIQTGDSVVRSAGLLTCSPLPYDSVTATIGPAGGTLQVGPHTFSVPAGALDSLVSITAVAPSDTVNRVQFQPQGLTFQQPASLVPSYANCSRMGSTQPLQIAYTNDSLQILDYVPSLDDSTSQTVTGQLRHFSDYAVAW